MAIKEQLYNRNGDEIFPVTLTDCISTTNGKYLAEEYATKKYADKVAADILNSSPEQLQTINTLGSKLADDNDLANAITKTVADAKKELFIDMWNDACKVGNGSDRVIYGKYNRETEFFELNGLNLSYEDALIIYNRTFFLRYNQAFPNIMNQGYGKHESRDIWIRTTLPITTAGATPFIGNFYTNRLLHTLCFHGEVYVLSWVNMFSGSNNALTRIIGVLNFSQQNFTTNITFCYATNPLKEFKIKWLKDSIMIPSTVANFESFRYLVDNAIGTNEKTVKVASNVYSALLGEGEFPLNDGTKEEWMQVASDALEKNIIFAI